MVKGKYRDKKNKPPSTTPQPIHLRIGEAQESKENKSSESEVQKHMPKDSASTRPHWADAIIAIFTGLILVTYITSDYFLWRQLNLTEKALQLDQRPYVWTSNVQPQFSVKVNERMWANIHMINYGKAPALKTSITGTVFVGPNAKNEAEQWFKGDVDKAFSDPAKNELVVPPGIPAPIPDNPLKATFGGGGVFTLMSENILKQPDVDFVTTHEEPFVIVGRLQYFDGFGNRYWSDICISKFTNGSMPFCEKHNDIH